VALGTITGLPVPFTPPTVSPIATPTTGGAARPQGAFASEVEGFVRSADTNAKEASHLMDEYAAGRQNDLHGTLIQAEKASVSLHLLVSVRNKIVDAYREMMRMGG
jgi:flagellar hook-basal body complex protein FliE